MHRLIALLLLPTLIHASTNSSSIQNSTSPEKPSTSAKKGKSLPNTRSIAYGPAPVACSKLVPECQCYQRDDGKLYAHCSQNIRKFPTDLPSKTTDLAITCNTKKDGTGMPIVDFVFFTSIPQNALAGMPNLEDITLSGCTISELPPLLFANLTRLRRLSLETMLLTRLDGTVLTGSYSLTHFYIMNMGNLRTVDPNLLKGQTRLATVVIKQTRLPGTEVKAMLYPVRNKITDLTWANSLDPVTIPKDTFAGYRFQTLDLSFNDLVNIEFLRQTRTRQLGLRGNPVFGGSSPFNLGTCQRLRGLIELDLRSTKMRVMPRGSLANMKRLRRLYLSGNELTAVPVDVYNGAPVKSLIVLDLSFNQLQTVPSEMERLMQRGDIKVQFIDNPFHCNCEVAWLLNYPKALENVICKSAPESKPALIGRPLRDLKKSNLICKAPDTPTIQVSNAALKRSDTLNALSQVNFVTERNSVLSYEDQKQVIEVSRGQTIILRCKSKGDPSPTLAWDFPWNATMTRMATRDRTIFGNELEAQVHQTELGSLSVAKFTCRASNLAGKSEKYINVMNLYPITTTFKPSKDSGGISDKLVDPTADGRNGGQKLISEKYCLFHSISFLITLRLIIWQP